jgi:hypothetical protein
MEAVRRTLSAGPIKQAARGAGSASRSITPEPVWVPKVQFVKEYI